MPHPTHHLFFSYARKDNRPTDDGGEGWITAFYRRLQAQHKAYTGHELKIFFDTEEIDHGGDWKGRLAQGLRTSRLFLAFLSPNYMRSPNCRWEWEEYLRREHSLARGEDGIRTIFFEIVPGLPGVDIGSTQAIEDELRADQEIARWLDMISAELHRRNAYLDPQDKHAAAGGLHPKAAFDLRPWFSKGPSVLAELDAAERLEYLRQNPKEDTDKIVTLADRLKNMDQHIATRLDRCLLADLAPGRHSLGRSYPHFVGRHKELRQLHDSLINGKVGVVTAVHGLGGQGKTALAIQYAHAYADFYAAGGRWVIPCEGVASMADAMMRLATQVELRFEVPPDVQADPNATVQFVLLRLEQTMQQNTSLLQNKLRADRERMSSDENLPEVAPRTLIILDNVDQPGLLAADQLALLPQSEWFELVVTTRLDPERFGIGKDLRPIPVDSLPIDDAVALIRDFQPQQQFANADDESGARRLCEILGGFTLLVELAAAYLGEHPDVRPNDYCNLLLKQGLPTSDDLAGEQEVAAHIRHREKQLSIVTDWTLARLDERARFVLEHASLLEPDSIMMEWLRDIAGQRYPELRDTESARQSALATLKDILTAQDDGSGNAHSIAAMLDDPETAAGAIQMLRPSLDAMPDEVKSQFEQILNDASLPVADRSQPNPWLAVWRQLKGLRLLTPGDEGTAEVSEGSARVGFSVPAVARIHRLIAAHVKDGLSAPASEACWQSLIRVTDQRAAAFQNSWQHSANDHWMVRPLGDNALHLAKQRPSSRELAENCGVIAQAEMTLGSLARAEQLVRQFSDNLRLQYNSDQSSEQTGRVLSAALTGLGDFYLARGQAGDAQRALAQFEESLKIDQRLFEANPNSAQAARDLSVSLERLGDFYLARGQAGDAQLALAQFEESLKIRKQIFEANPNSAQAARDLSVSLNKLGDFYLARGQAGDAQLALTQFEESLNIRKQIFEANPNSAQAARDLSVSLDRLGDFYLARGQAGDAQLALTQFEQSHRTLKRLFEANPNSALAARDLSVSLDRLGDFYLARGQAGDAQLALAQFEESLKISQRLFEANPNSAQAARDLSVSLNKLGDFYLARGQAGDAQLALTQFEESHRTLKRLFEANPNSAQAARDLSVSLNKLGDFYLARGQAGDAQLALAQFEESLKISQRLFEANPNSAQAARDLSVSLDRLGDFYLARGQAGDAQLALAKFEESLKIRKRLFEANPNSAQAARDLSVSLNKLGDFYLARGQAGDAQLALAQFEESLKISQRLFEANPNSAQAARDLLISLERLSDIAGSSNAPDSASHALELQSQALQLALKLHQANPASASAGQDAADSALRTSKKAHAAGQEELARQSLIVCYSVLHTLVENRCELKPSMRDLYQKLQEQFSNSSTEESP